METPPKFKVINFTDQISKNAEESTDGLKSFGDSLVERKNIQINQSRKLMSDLDAVISEVEDMHKESVGLKIDEVKDKLANNIYKKKGKNGVKLSLKDVNSDDFNYARQMRGLKNIATNSRLSKEMLLEFQQKLPNDKYFKSENDRTAAAAAFVDKLSNLDNLDQSQGQLRQMLNDEYRKYRDNGQEYIDKYIEDQPLDTSTSTSKDAQGNLMQRTSTFIESLILKDADGNIMRDKETGQVLHDEDQIKKIAQNALIPKTDFNGNVIPTGLTQQDIPVIEEELRNKAIQSKEKVLSTKGQLYSQYLSDQNSKSLTKSRDESTNNPPPSAAQQKEEVLSDVQLVADYMREGDEGAISSFIGVLKSEPGTEDVVVLSSKGEYMEAKYEAYKRKQSGDLVIPEGFKGSEFQKEVTVETHWYGDDKIIPGNKDSGWESKNNPKHTEALKQQIKEYLARDYQEGGNYLIRSYDNKSKSPEVLNLSDPANKTAIVNQILKSTDFDGAKAFGLNTIELMNLMAENNKNNKNNVFSNPDENEKIPDLGTDRSLPSDRPEGDIDPLNLNETS